MRAGGRTGTNGGSRVVWLVAAAAAGLYALMSYGGLRFGRLGADLGIFDQAAQAYSQFRTPYIPIKAQAPFNILGDHFSPIIALVAPLYGLLPYALTLMIVQAVLVAGCVGFVGWYARKRGLGTAAYFVQGGFALSYGVLAAVNYDFHEIAFGLPVLLWALWALLEKHDVQLVVACLAMATVKEDMPLYMAGIALVLFLSGRRLFGVVMGAASVAITVLLIYVVIPIFSYWGHYAYVGTGARGFRSVPAMLWAAVRHVASWEGLTFLLLIALVTGLGWKSKLVWVLLPTVVFRFMANDAVYLGFHFHYGILLTGIAFMAMIDGWQRWDGVWGWSSARFWLVQKWLLLAGAVLGLLASGALLALYGVAGAPGMVADRQAVVAQIPDGASVAADPYMLDFVVDKVTVQVAYPAWTDETGAPIEADWVLLDTGTRAFHNLKGNPWVDGLIEDLTRDGRYEVVDRQGRFVLLRLVDG